MNRLLHALLAVALPGMLLVTAPAALARTPVPLDAARAIAGATPGELLRRLKASHARVDRALGLRRSRFDAWQLTVLKRDEAAGRVEQMKREGQRGDALDRALRETLVLDERANIARSQLMAAEAQVAKNGADLLRLFDATLTLKRREIEEARTKAQRTKLVKTYGALAAQRDKVRRSLGPVLRAGDKRTPGADRSVSAQPTDDIETLLEKADLARDLEDRFLRRAQAVEVRIREAMEEQAVARDVAGLLQSQRLFDEDDMRLFVVSGDVGAAKSLASALPAGGGGGAPALLGAPAADSLSPGAAEERAEDTQSDGDGVFTGGVEGPDAAPPAPAAPPADPMAPPEAGAVNDDANNSFESDTGGDRAADVATPLAPDIGGVALPRSAERAFAAGSADVRLEALLSSGELTLPQLRTLQKKLRARAAKMRAQESTLKGEVERRARR